MRFTIERIRTLVLAAGVLLVAALAVFLAIGKWRSLLGVRELPKRLGADIVQEANGVTYTQSHGGHTLFRIHASRVEQLKNGHSLLHNVTIDLYGQDGRSVDRIEGNDFEYDQQSGVATAAGKVEITIARPSEALAIAPRAAGNGKPDSGPLQHAAQSAAAGAIHVETSGLSFNQKTEVVSTPQRAEFSMARGSGSAVGASYNSQQGELVLEHSVELITARGGEPVTIHAAHAEFQRGEQLCILTDATAGYRGGDATAGVAKVLFRGDGSAERLDATDGFTLATATGGHLAAPRGTLEFDRRNQPRHGVLEGGVKMNSTAPDRQFNGTAPSAALDFSAQGELRQVEWNHGVEFESESEADSGTLTGGVPAHVKRTWRSPVAEVQFRRDGNGRVEPAAIQGSGGVVVTTETRRGNAAPVPARLKAGTVTGEFGPGSVLAAMTGIGHASLEQTTAKGARQTATGDRITARFEAAAAPPGHRAEPGAGVAQIQSAQLEGHVVLVQEPAPKPGTPPQPPMRTTAGMAEYDGAGQWLHLSENPRIEDGDLALTAEKVDVSEQSDEAFAHGDVKATWMGGGGPGAVGRSGATDIALGGNGPAHVIAEEAQFNQSSSEATFRGHARLWQGADSIAGPVLVLNRQRQTLVARSANPAEPVRAVLLSNATPAAQPAIEPVDERRGRTGRRPTGPSVIRVRGGDFTYSDAEHSAWITGGALGQVVAETGDATCTADKVALTLRAPQSRNEHERAEGQVERMTASGHVVISSQGRRGAGARLVYTGATGQYVLTGTPSAPPRLTDPARGTVTGQALIFNSRDDSVSIEGGGRETTTETTAPK